MHRRHLVEAETTVRLGNVHGRQAELGAALEQMHRERQRDTVDGDALLVLDGLDPGHDLRRDEALGGSANLQLLVAEPLARRDPARRHRGGEKTAPTHLAL